MRSQNRLLLFFPLLLLSFSIFAQPIRNQVKRQLVVVEVGTGFWCYNCPGAAWALEEMLELGHNIAALEYHSNDSLATEATTHRHEYYGIEAVPTAYFDGDTLHRGGSTDESVYPKYLPLYDYRNALLSSFTLDMSYTNSDRDYSVSINAEKVADYSGENLVLHLVLTESHLPYAWQVCEEVNHAVRMMIPNQFGSPLDFSTHPSQTIDLNFTMPSWYIPENCELVAFIQDNDTKEILQGEKIIFKEPEFNREIKLGKIISPNGSYCTPEVQGRILVKNEGVEKIESLTIDYWINEEPHSYEWTGEIKSERGCEIDLPLTWFNYHPEGTIEVEISNPNGQNDQDPSDNQLTKTFKVAKLIDFTQLNVEVKIASYWANYTWALLDNKGDVLEESGPFPGIGTYHHTFENLPQEGCYSFVMYDSYGDGMCSEGSYYELTDGDNNLIIHNCDFEYADYNYFNHNLHLGLANPQQDTGFAARVFPNPTSGPLAFEIELSEESAVQIEILNQLGQELEIIKTARMSTGTHRINWDAPKGTKGLCFYRIYAGKLIRSGKFMIR